MMMGTYKMGMDVLLNVGDKVNLRRISQSEACMDN